jgi:hypothetical protein
VDRGSSSCLTLGGLRLDHAVVAAVLEALQPAGVQAALEAIEQVGAAQDTKRQAVTLALEKARDEAQRAQRHYALVAPAHRLVAGELERRWNEALERGTELEAHVATRKNQQITRREEPRQGLRHVGQALRAVWQHPAAPAPLKKRLLRTVLYAMIITTTPEPPEHLLHLHWHGGVHTEWRVARTAAGNQGRATHPDVLAVIRALSQGCADRTLAATLHRLGYRTGTGKPWRAHRVACVRSPDRRPNSPQGNDGLPLTQAAAQWGGRKTVVTRLLAQGPLPASQVGPQAPWILQRSALALPAVHAEGQTVRSGRRPRLRPGPSEVPMDSSYEGGDVDAASLLMDTPTPEPACRGA